MGWAEKRVVEREGAEELDKVEFVELGGIAGAERPVPERVATGPDREPPLINTRVPKFVLTDRNHLRANKLKPLL